MYKSLAVSTRDFVLLLRKKIATGISISVKIEATIAIVNLSLIGKREVIEALAVNKIVIANSLITKLAMIKPPGLPCSN